MRSSRGGCRACSARTGLLGAGGRRRAGARARGGYAAAAPRAGAVRRHARRVAQPADGSLATSAPSANATASSPTASRRRPPSRAARARRPTTRPDPHPMHRHRGATLWTRSQAPQPQSQAEVVESVTEKSVRCPARGEGATVTRGYQVRSGHRRVTYRWTRRGCSHGPGWDLQRARGFTTPVR
jgi:hypothetical protein